MVMIDKYDEGRMMTMNKHKRRSFKKYRGQGK